ncbi:mycofactocin biosynthesis chaperone MftB [Gordonia sp. PKS22-38]|uniref:Mycofactocin biosynthesis chaperone MftB n=1 Tax=Gordonia prachuapensis TaxID=3115651 RepID=A0ABU7MMI0_9ACTN|nr:mycofactocin biosynthesis chaperone MftB [Gordonia sp. PKS22-38]
MSVPTSSPVSGGRDATAGPGPTPVDPAPFDIDAAWELNPKVALRPEPFGALLYHFGTRKLSFLKNLTVVGIVQSLADHRSADEALAAAGIEAAERPLYLQALRALADSGMITRRPPRSSPDA